MKMSEGKNALVQAFNTSNLFFMLYALCIQKRISNIARE